MENNNPSVMALPPHPPAVVSTVILARVSLLIGLGSSFTFFAAYAYPEDDFLRQAIAVVSSFTMLIPAFVIGLRAVLVESKRSQYRNVVENYSRITGDARYDPYVLKSHMIQVSILFTLSMIVAFVLPMIGLIGKVQ